MVIGTTSGAGTSTVVTALCRALARRGLRVAPFKGQHASDHGAVTPDGGEIGRAQAVQALAARVEADRRMAPVLLRPAGDDPTRLVVMGKDLGGHRTNGHDDPEGVRPVVLDALSSLRREHDLVLLEGAGGAADLSRVERDVVTLPLAAAAGVPAVLVVDVDRGGTIASAFGTWALLPDHLREHLRGFVLNCHRGDAEQLADELHDLETRTGVPVLGVLPHLGERPVLGVEESPPAHAVAPSAAAPSVEDPLRVAAVRLPHLSDPSDLDPLLLEPHVELRWVTSPAELGEADLVILPSTRRLIDDLGWLREQGLDHALSTLNRRVRLFGLDSGYQMLGGLIHDDVVTGAGTVEGLGLLPVETTFESPKIVCRAVGRVVGTEIPVEGYQIRWGRVRRLGGHPLFDLDLGAACDDGSSLEGCVSDRHIRGTSLHGVFECDRLRQALLWKVAAARGRTFVPSTVPFRAAFDAHVDRLADWVDQHLDVGAVLRLADQAAAPGQEPGW